MAEDVGRDDVAWIPGYTHATYGTNFLGPEVFIDLFHGASAELERAYLVSNGLPSKGTDIDLVKHAEHPAGYDPADSAFRGTLQYPAFPGFCGPVHWAGVGGLVFHIHMWRGYDLSRLDGLIPTPTGFRSIVLKEKEIAIPARVPRKYVRAIGNVEANYRGQLKPVWRR